MGRRQKSNSYINFILVSYKVWIEKFHSEEIYNSFGNDKNNNNEKFYFKEQVVKIQTINRTNEQLQMSSTPLIIQQVTKVGHP